MQTWSIILTGFVSGMALFAAVGAQTMFIIKHGAAGKRMAPVIIASIISDFLLVTLGVGGIGQLTGAFPQVMTILTLVGALFLLCYGGSALWRALKPARKDRQTLDLAEVGEVQESVATDPAERQHIAEARRDSASAAEARQAGASGSTLVVHRPAQPVHTDASASGAADGPLLDEAGRSGAHADVAEDEGLTVASTAKRGLRKRVSAPLARHATISAVLTLLAFTWLNPQSYFDVTVILGSMAANYGDPGRWVFSVGLYSASVTWFLLLGFGAKALGRVVVRYPRFWKYLDLGTGIVMIGMAGLLLTHLN